MRHNEASICPTCEHVRERITHIYYGDLVTRPTKRTEGQEPKIAMWYLCHYCTADCPGGCGQARMYCECNYQIELFGAASGLPSRARDGS